MSGKERRDRAKRDTNIGSWKRDLALAVGGFAALLVVQLLAQTGSFLFVLATSFATTVLVVLILIAALYWWNWYQAPSRYLNEQLEGVASRLDQLRADLDHVDHRLQEIDGNVKSLRSSQEADAPATDSAQGKRVIKVRLTLLQQLQTGKALLDQARQNPFSSMYDHGFDRWRSTVVRQINRLLKDDEKTERFLLAGDQAANPRDRHAAHVEALEAIVNEVPKELTVERDALD